MAARTAAIPSTAKRSSSKQFHLTCVRADPPLPSLRWRYAWSWTPSDIATVVAQLEDPFEVMRGGVIFDLLKPV
ncbi:hypothetical protein AB0D65_31875 [Streptomyces griseoloalbus]|uniref:Uncharacterized protein n=1 Tax=Streptomyces griseoloalbus TaxID=67303 RepID=A0ABV3EE96_9ACTN